MNATIFYLLGLFVLILTAAIPAAATALIQWAETQQARQPIRLKGRPDDQRPTHVQRTR